MSRLLRPRRAVATAAAGLLLLTACGGDGAGSAPDAAETGEDADSGADTDVTDPDA